MASYRTIFNSLISLGVTSVTDGNRQLSSDVRRSQPNITSVDVFRDERTDYQSTNSGAHPLTDYIRIALVHRRLIMTVSLVIVSLTTIYSYLATPLYTAETEIGIGAYSPTVKGTGLEESIAKQSEKQDYLETQIKQITRLTLADKMLSDKGLGEEIKTYLKNRTSILGSITGMFSNLLSTKNEKEVVQESGSSYQHPIGLLKSYLSLVSVSPVKRTFLVKISATTSDPELSAKIANTHSLNFIELAKEEKQKTALTNLVFLRSQAEELSSKVAVIEQEIAKYAEENAIVALNQDESIVLRRMSELNQLLTEATGKKIKAESAFNEAKDGGNISSNSSDAQGLEDLKLRLRDKEGEYANLGQKFKPAYPAMVQLKAEIDSLKGNLKKQETLIVRNAEAEYKANLASEEELKRELEMQKSKAFDLSRRSVKYNSMKREFDSLVLF